MQNNLELYFLVTFITVLTPGAGVLFTVMSALRNGFRNAWQAPLGNVLSSAVVGIVCAAGLGAVLTTSPVLFALVQTASACVLLWLGWRAWHAPARGFASLEAAAAERHEAHEGRSLFASAFVLQLTNPMLFVFQVSMLPQFISPEEPYMPQAALLIAIFAANGIVIHFAYSYLAAWARRFLAGPHAVLVLNRTSAALFWFFGVSVLARAVSQGLPGVA